MNKIKKLHENILLKEFYEFNNYSENTYTEDNSLTEIQAFECAEITKDIAVKFSLWQQLGECEWILNDEDEWYIPYNPHVRINTEELFNIFIESL